MPPRLPNSPTTHTTDRALLSYTIPLQQCTTYARFTNEEFILPLKNGSSIKVSRTNGEITFDGDVDVNEAATQFWLAIKTAFPSAH